MKNQHKKLSLKSRLAYFRIWQVSGQMIGRSNSIIYERCECVNCGEMFNGNYCPNCGQSAKEKRLTLRSAFENLFSLLLNTDKGFVYTLLCLIFRPGYMILDYIRGKRARYTRPVQLLFFTVTIFFVIDYVANLSFNIGQSINDYLDKVVEDVHTDTLANTDTHNMALVSQFPQYVEPDSLHISNKTKVVIRDDNNGNEFLLNMAAVGAIIESIKSWVVNHMGVVALLIMLFLIFPMWISYRTTNVGKTLNLTECFFAIVFMGSQAFLLRLILFAVPNGIMLFIVYPIMFICNCHQLYRISWKSSLKRMLLFSFLMFIEFVVVVTVVSFFAEYIFDSL
ncbi:MAG: DUF3667 domain-containing protein [Salinivirgaceae bacterium]|nr:DUF3667 domain-containing protein [Salinivirgaceae bacterium]